jgi:hypothetical protein
VTPRGRLDESCFYDWIEGMVYIALFAVMVAGFSIVIGTVWALL